ncbi:MAG: lysostaphin resistance A-like protein [Promethearchaeota archaeon]
MVINLEEWKIIFKSLNFFIGSCFLLILCLLLFIQETILIGGEFLFGLIFIFVLGGFFVYIFIPELVVLNQRFLNTPKRQIIPPFCVFTIFMIFHVIVPTSADLLINIIQIVSGFIFILTPSILYMIFHEKTKRGLSCIDVVAGLWVWIPIEFGIADDFLGLVELGKIPFDTLLALFAFIYALIFVRHHDMGLSFTFSKDDLFIVILAIGTLLIVIAPIGMLSYFLAPPRLIVQNIEKIISEIPGSLIEIIFTFILIFLGTALIEELFFRGFVFKLLVQKFEEKDLSSNWWYGGIVGLAGLITITPWIEYILQSLSWIPLFSLLKDIVGSMAKPLGNFEGKAWPLVQSIPLEVLYLIVALILAFFAIILINETHDSLVAALVLSSILFGWAHFEDPRYILFASLAGLLYGWTYWKTQKIVPAALVHTTVNTVWGILFSF